MRRRAVLALGVTTILGISGVGSVVAQDATPMTAASLGELGLPELTITADERGLHVDQEEIPAGRYLVSLNVTVQGGYIASGFVRLAAGRSPDDLRLADESAAGTPIMEQAGAQDVDLAWLFDAYIAGGPSSFTPQVVVNLPAATYGVLPDDPGSLVGVA